MKLIGLMWINPQYRVITNRIEAHKKKVNPIGNTCMVIINIFRSTFFFQFGLIKILFYFICSNLIAVKECWRSTEISSTWTCKHHACSLYDFVCNLKIEKQIGTNRIKDASYLIKDARNEDPQYGLVDTAGDYGSILGCSNGDSGIFALRLQPNQQPNFHSGSRSELTTYTLLE